MTLGRTKGVDILVSDPKTGNKMYKLKAVTSCCLGKVRITDWPMDSKGDENTADPCLFYCFISLDLLNQNTKFFIVPSKVVAKWRGYASHLKVVNEKAGYQLAGKIDDVLVEKDGRLIPTDFKSSGYAPKDDKQKYYVAQLNAYALMFREHGYKSSDRAYLLHYFVKDTKKPIFERGIYQPHRSG